VNGNSYDTAKSGATFTSGDIDSFMANYMFKNTSDTQYILNPSYTVPAENLTSNGNESLGLFDDYVFNDVNSNGMP